MLRVLRHYLPVRRALLVFSETILLTLVISGGMTVHLDEPTEGVIASLAQMGLGQEGAWQRCIVSAFLLAVLSQVLISFNELYDFRISSSNHDRAARFVGSSGGAIAVGLVSVLLARFWHLERVLDFPGLSTSQLVQTLVFTMLVGFSLLYFWRHVFHFVMKRWNFNERVLILGAGIQAQTLAAEMQERPDSGYEAVGMLPETAAAAASGGRRSRDRNPESVDFATGHIAERVKKRIAAQATSTLLLDPIVFQERSSHTHVRSGLRLSLGGSGSSSGNGHGSSGGNGNGNGNGNGHGGKAAGESLLDLVRRLRVDTIAVALEDRRLHLPTDELLECRLGGVRVTEREALYERITGKLAVEAMRPSYLIFNDGFGRSQRSELLKRGSDTVLSVIGILLVWPLMLLTALLVRLDSPGPVLFRQTRVGIDGKPFTLMKFRSMRTDAEQETGPVWATEDDPRITRAGRFLRKSRLDELPQLFNVLGGHMSLVGPRPERPVFVEDLERQIPYYSQRHIVRPGVTGWAQINYPYGSSVEDALQKLQYDLFYVKNLSLMFDLSILFTTIKTVVLRKGT